MKRLLKRGRDVRDETRAEVHHVTYTSKCVEEDGVAQVRYREDLLLIAAVQQRLSLLHIHTAKLPHFRSLLLQ